MESAYTPPIVKIPLPADFSDERDEDVLRRASAMCGAAEEILANMLASGQTPEISDDDRLDARTVFDTGNLPQNVPTGIALHLTALLTAYDMTVVQSSQQIRNLCTNLLIEKAVKGKTEQTQLRAVEMLGKIKDVALFEERSTVLVEHMTTDQIKDRLKEKIGRLKHLAGDAVDVTPNTAVIPSTPSSES